MGTRSLTVFVDEHSKKEIVVMYRQYDGYIEWYGKRLCDYLQSFDEVVNGIGMNDYVIVPSHTAMATISAIVEVGAKPLFIDILCSLLK